MIKTEDKILRVSIMWLIKFELLYTFKLLKIRDNKFDFKYFDRVLY